MTQSEVAALGAWWWGLGVGKELECIIEGLLPARKGQGCHSGRPQRAAKGVYGAMLRQIRKGSQASCFCNVCPGN